MKIVYFQYFRPMKQQCYALDLINDPTLIAEYETYHRNVWPEIEESIRASGRLSMKIYRVENRLFMIVDEVENPDFQPETLHPEKVMEWETLMWKYQQQLPNSYPGEKWRLMECIYSLTPGN